MELFFCLELDIFKESQLSSSAFYFHPTLSFGDVLKSVSLHYHSISNLAVQCVFVACCIYFVADLLISCEDELADDG